MAMIIVKRIKFINGTMQTVVVSGIAVWRNVSRIQSPLRILFNGSKTAFSLQIFKLTLSSPQKRQQTSLLKRRVNAAVFFSTLGGS